MRTTLKALALALALGAVSLATAHSDAVSVPSDKARLDERLKTFDPEAVAAARHYYDSPQMRDGMMGMIRSMAPGMLAAAEKRSGKRLGDEDRKRFIGALDAAFAEQYDYLLGLNMVVALQVLTKEQVLAIDRFYGSEMGRSIVAKMPEIGGYTGQIMQSFLPGFQETLQEKIAQSAK